MKKIKVGATLAVQYLGTPWRGFYNLVEAGEIEFTRNPRIGHRQFSLVELDRIRTMLANRPRRGRPRVQFPDYMEVHGR